MFAVLLMSALVGHAASTFDPELHAKFLELPRDQFVQYFNSQNYTWKINHHPHMENRHHNCLLTENNHFRNLTVKQFDPHMYVDLPENFDAREKWSNCETIKEIYNQGFCGSCWAFATAALASDRTCIGKGLTVRLSKQDFECLQPLCNGGSPSKSFPFWRDHGLVTSECKSYKMMNRDCVQACDDSSRDYANDKHYADNVYAISSNENDIKTELFTNGPIFAGFTVYEDFAHDYKSGIYEHKYGESVGAHAVKIIGYGVENGVAYWLVANSWGPKWGENGFFRIKRYQDFELPFESMLYSGTAKN